MWRSVVCWKLTDIPEEYVASIFRVIGHWRWRGAARSTQMSVSIYQSHMTSHLLFILIQPTSSLASSLRYILIFYLPCPHRYSKFCLSFSLSDVTFPWSYVNSKRAMCPAVLVGLNEGKFVIKDTRNCWQISCFSFPTNGNICGQPNYCDVFQVINFLAFHLFTRLLVPISKASYLFLWPYRNLLSLVQ